MTAPSAPVLLWLRRDLRLADNPALRAALASARPVVPVFVLDEDGAGAWAPGAASRWWLHHSLTALPEPGPARIPRGPSIASDTVDSWGLLWREFAAHLLWHNPSLPDAPLRAEFAAMPWRDDPAGLRAWQRGQTGIPIVDAGRERALQAFAALRKAA